MSVSSTLQKSHSRRFLPVAGVPTLCQPTGAVGGRPRGVVVFCLVLNTFYYVREVHPAFPLIRGSGLLVTRRL